jgi:hypothetical protein
VSKYKGRFEALLGEVRNNPALEVVEYTVHPPAEEKALRAVEKKLGAALAPAIRDFYSEMNGLKLRWRVKPLLPMPETKALRKLTAKDYPVEIAEPATSPYACINLIPIEESIVNQSWPQLEALVGPEPIDYRGKDRTLEEFQQQVKPFDLFHREWVMAFVIEEGVGDPDVILLTEGFMHWELSRITRFESYIEMLLVTRGISAAREKIYFAKRGDLKPVLIPKPEDWKKRVPKLFQPVAKG